MAEQPIPDASGIQGQLAQINIELGKQSTQLAVINTKLDGVISSASDHEGRIRALERFRFTLLGVVLTTSAAFSALGTWIGYVIGHGK
jgi:hypothetical protein